MKLRSGSTSLDICDVPDTIFLFQALEKVGLKWSMLATTSWDSMYDTLVEYVEAKVSEDFKAAVIFLQSKRCMLTHKLVLYFL